jgi:hypothetical protein
MAVPPARHRWHHAELIKQFSVPMDAILATPTRVVYQSARWAYCRHTPKQRLADQVSGHALVHGIAHEVYTEQIFVACQIELTLISWDVGDVGHTDLIGDGRLEFLLQ